MAHLRYGECASYLQFLKEICFTLFISPLHFRKFSPLTLDYFNNETIIMVANSLAPMFPAVFRAMLKSLGSSFLPIGCVTVRLRLSLVPVVAMFDRSPHENLSTLIRYDDGRQQLQAKAAKCLADAISKWED
jgi:hypothetical protein